MDAFLVKLFWDFDQNESITIESIFLWLMSAFESWWMASLFYKQYIIKKYSFINKIWCHLIFRSFGIFGIIVYIHSMDLKSSCKKTVPTFSYIYCRTTNQLKYWLLNFLFQYKFDKFHEFHTFSKQPHLIKLSKY
jgi:hypothetical protein